MRDGVSHLCHTELFSGIAASIEWSIATASEAQSQQRLAAARRLARPAGLGTVRGERERAATLPEGRASAASSRSEEARPAGLEPATPGLEVLREEATGGSAKPLPLILRASSHTRDNSQLPRAATHCQSFVSRLSPPDDDELFVGDSVSNPDTRSRDLNERLPSFQRDDNRAEVGFDAVQQFHPPRVSDPNPDDSRAFLQNPANREVLIFRDDHRIGLRCVAANRIVGRSRKPTIEDARPSGRALQGAAPAQVAAERRRESAITRSAGQGDRSGGRRIPGLP